MTVVDTIRETWYRATGRSELANIITEQRRALSEERATREFLQESLGDLEAAMQEPGWQRLTMLAEREFTRDGLGQITAVCRVMAIKNPLIKRGLALRTAYVWGQGVEISARAADSDGAGQDVNAVVQAFLDDESNRRTFTSAQAHEQLERALGTDGNVFLALFTAPKTGRVQVRTLPFDEIADVICNPDDASEPWFYKRDWWVERLDPRSGGKITERQVAYYPALGYRPRLRPLRIRGEDGTEARVVWDAPVVHVKVGGLLGWKFGIPDSYAAIDWAAAYREFLTDWARLVKALSRFAWRLTAKGGKQAAAKAKLAQAPEQNPLTGEPLAAGATALVSPEMALEAIPKSGATIDSDSGRPLAMMVASALDVPVTMLLSDPGQTGARAVAETLDQPTELAMGMRRQLWTDVLATVLDYVIDQAVKAPAGPLSGTVARDADGRERVELGDEADRTIDISWPDLDDVPAETIVKAIVAADQTEKMPPLVTARLLLEALGVRNVDEILAMLTDDEGNFVAPDVTAGQVAVDRFNQGRDPVAALNGPPATGDEPDEPAE